MNPVDEEFYEGVDKYYLKLKGGVEERPVVKSELRAVVKASPIYHWVKPIPIISTPLISIEQVGKLIDKERASKKRKGCMTKKKKVKQVYIEQKNKDLPDYETFKLIPNKDLVVIKYLSGVTKEMSKQQVKKLLKEGRRIVSIVYRGNTLIINRNI